MSWLGERMHSGGGATGHPRQCKAIKRNSKDPRKIGRQCIKWACKGHQFCPQHGGKTIESEKGRHAYDPRYSELGQLESLPHVYSRYLSDKLSKRMADLAGVSDELDLKEELALMRSVTTDAIQLYDIAVNVPDEVQGAQEARIAAGSIVRECISEVRDMVESIVAIEEQRRETLTVPSLHIVVTQIVELMYDELGNEVPLEKIKDLADRLKDIRLPSQEIQGTLLTPDQDVREMDETIPAAAPGSDSPRIAGETQKEGAA